MEDLENGKYLSFLEYGVGREDIYPNIFILYKK